MLAARRMMNLQPIDPCLRDTANRVANSSSPNPASDGGAWTVFAGTYGIEVISGVSHLYNSGYGFWPTGGSASNNNGPDPLGANPAMGRDLGSAVQDVTWRIHCDDATDRFVMVNFDPATRSAYMLDTNGSTIFRLWRSPSNAGGSRTLLASFTFTTFTTSTVRVVHDGAGHLTVLQDGNTLGTATDASPLTGTWVCVADATNGNTHSANWWDSFSACPAWPFPTFVASSSAVTSPSSVTSINVTVPAATQVGDVIVIAATMHDVPLTFATPTGYTLAQDQGDNVSRLTAWYKIAASGDPGSTVTVSITGGGVEWPAALCLVYRNIDQATPLVTSANGSSGSTTPWPAPTVTAGSKPAIGVFIWGTFRGATTYPITSFGSGTARVDVVGTGREIAAADKALAALATGSVTATPTAAQEYVAISLVFSGA